MTLTWAGAYCVKIDNCISHLPLDLSDRLHILKLESDPTPCGKKSCLDPFVNVKGSGQEADCCQKGREERGRLEEK